jgi:hypothetical protein
VFTGTYLSQKYSVGLEEIFISRLHSQKENIFHRPCLWQTVDWPIKHESRLNTEQNSNPRSLLLFLNIDEPQEDILLSGAAHHKTSSTQ